MPMLPTSNYTFGPKFISFFDFPNVGNWSVFFYLKIQVGVCPPILLFDPLFFFFRFRFPHIRFSLSCIFSFLLLFIMLLYVNSLGLGDEFRLIVPDFSFATVDSPNTPTFPPVPTTKPRPTRAPTSPPSKASEDDTNVPGKILMIAGISCLALAVIVAVIWGILYKRGITIQHTYRLLVSNRQREESQENENDYNLM